MTVIATANAGYSFTGWTEGGVAVSASASYTFTASANRSLVAEFAPITYSVVTAASPIAGGATSGGGTFNSGNSVTVVALASPGYSFTGWTEGGVAVSASASYTFTASANRSLVAGFAPMTYSIATAASPIAGGATSGGGTFNSGNSVTVVAVANAGYSFTGWTEGGVAVSASASYTFTAGANRSLVAGFAPSSTAGKIRSLRVSSPVEAGEKIEAEIKLVAKAPLGGLTILLSSSDPTVLQLPVSVYVPAGEKSVSFKGTTSTVATVTNVKVTVTLGASSESEIVQILPRHGHD